MLYEEKSTVYVRLDGDRITDISMLPRFKATPADGRPSTPEPETSFGTHIGTISRARPLDGRRHIPWKLAGGKPVERTAEEIAADRAALVPPRPPALEQLRADVGFSEPSCRGRSMNVEELARKYYPRLWDKRRIRRWWRRAA